MDLASIFENSDGFLFDSMSFRSVSSAFPMFSIFLADLYCHFLQEMRAGHPQVAQRKPRV